MKVHKIAHVNLKDVGNITIECIYYKNGLIFICVYNLI